MKLKSLVAAILFTALWHMSTAQVQKGNDIDGEAAGDKSGSSVCMPDANTVAIGARYNGGNGIYAGQVRIFDWSGTSWIQRGADIDGEAEGDQSGYSVSMPDANTVAIGAIHNAGTITAGDMGQVRIYIWNGSAWTQKGTDIDGEATGDRFGTSVSMPDANTVAIGANYNDGNGATDAGEVSVYIWNGSAWVQKGNDIEGEATFNQSGYSVSMPDSNTVAIGAPNNSGNGSGAGQVRIYTWNGTTWIQKGGDIDGEASSDFSGCSVSMSDMNTVAIGAWSNDGNGADAGQVRVYNWSGSAWVQKGSDIDGATATGNFGFSVSMPDANTVAGGAWGDDIIGADAGRAYVYTWNGSAWLQKGSMLNAEAAGDQSGWCVSMPDTNTIAVGASDNNGNGSDAGHVRVYSFSTATSIAESGFAAAVKYYPNPSLGLVNINLGEYHNAVVTVRNVLGQEISKQIIEGINTFSLYIEGNAGLYIIDLTTGSQNVELKIVKQ